MIYLVGPQIVFEEKDEEIQVYNPWNGQFYQLTGIHMEIFKMFFAGSDEETIINDLVEQTKKNQPEIEMSVKRFMENALKENLIEPI